ncbi:MAG: 4Fe-4S dicluster domain-containing protein [Desulfatiglandales bacterium]|jgi:Fe-S-cluster-containing hydrogenase component 2|nr:4Fe-4S dicluster domain-containing protein [Desulfatiglandales bacterium]
MEKVIVVEPDKCTGCKVCEMICSLHHEDEINPIKSRIHITSWEEDGIDIPMVCQQCEDPPCRAVCPTSAIYLYSQTGAMLIDEEKCIGCRMCINACPFGAPIVLPETRKVVKCDLCSGEPQCVEFCEPKAIQYIPATKGAHKKQRAVAKKFGELSKIMTS